MVFFKIGDLATPTAWTDFSAYTNKLEFAVNKTEITEEWTDGNLAIRRALVRTRVLGEFQLGFDSGTDLTGFLSALANRRPDNAFNVQIYCQNTGTVETITAYLDITGSGTFDEVNSRQWVVLDVTVTEV